MDARSFICIWSELHFKPICVSVSFTVTLGIEQIQWEETEENEGHEKGTGHVSTITFHYSRQSKKNQL